MGFREDVAKIQSQIATHSINRLIKQSPDKETTMKRIIGLASIALVALTGCSDTDNSSASSAPEKVAAESTTKAEKKFEPDHPYYFFTDEGADGLFTYNVEPLEDLEPLLDALSDLSDMSGEDYSLDGLTLAYMEVDNREGDSSFYHPSVYGYTEEGVEYEFTPLANVVDDIVLPHSYESDAEFEVQSVVWDEIWALHDGDVAVGEYVRVWMVAEDAPDEFVRMTVNGGDGGIDGATLHP